MFVGSANALSTGGPAALIICYLIIAIVVYCMLNALAELSIMFPVAGSFQAYSTRFFDSAWGFAMGWNYAICWLITLPLEIVAASITLRYWPSVISREVWITLIVLIILAINLFGVKGYAEAETVFTTVKVAAVVSFMYDLSISPFCLSGCLH